jgi:hypothetical protein
MCCEEIMNTAKEMGGFDPEDGLTIKSSKYIMHYQAAASHVCDNLVEEQYKEFEFLAKLWTEKGLPRLQQQR